MNVEQIKAFHKVALTGSFTKAARELFVTQPAVSQEIKTLETFLGIRLFHRFGKKVQLTVEGEILFSYSQRLFTLHEEMESLFVQSKNLQHGQIKIGSTALMGTYFLPKMMGRFNRRNRVNMEREAKKEDPNFILRCGGKRGQHFENDGKLYGIRPVCHYDTNCPYKEGTCHTYCLGLPITQRQCLKEDYRNSI